MYLSHVRKSQGNPKMLLRTLFAFMLAVVLSFNPSTMEAKPKKGKVVDSTEVEEGDGYAVSIGAYYGRYDGGMTGAFQSLYPGLEVDFSFRLGGYNPADHPGEFWSTNGVGVRLLRVPGTTPLRFIFGGSGSGTIDRKFKAVGMQLLVGGLYKLSDSDENVTARIQVLVGGGGTVRFDRWNNDATSVVADWSFTVTWAVPIRFGWKKK